MTKGQRIALQAEWWPAACETQGWKTSDRDLRLRVCMWAVSLENPSQHELLAAINSDQQPARWLASTNELDNKVDIDRVKACLGMLADKMRETGEVGRPEIGRARRMRDLIRDHIKCLALYHARPRAYVGEIINDKFNSWRKYGPPVGIKDLTADLIITKKGREIPSQLDQLVMRVAAVVNQKRNENILVPPYTHLQGTEPLTIHEMKLTSGVRCDCAICQKIGNRGWRKEVLVQPLEENWADFESETEQVNAGDEGEPF